VDTETCSVRMVRVRSSVEEHRSESACVPASALKSSSLINKTTRYVGRGADTYGLEVSSEFMPIQPFFMCRRDADGSEDWICLRCFRTAANSHLTSECEATAAAHSCKDLRLEQLVWWAAFNEALDDRRLGDIAAEQAT